MPDLIDEVEEDLRRERYARLWQRYGWMAVALVIAIVGGTAGWQVWQWRARTTAQAATAQILEALRDPAAPAAATALSGAMRDGGAGPRTLATLIEAARLATAGDAPGAQARWQAVAADQAADPLYRDLATLLSAMQALDSAEPAQLAARLAPLSAPGNPWRHAAAELVALLAERRGDRAAAIAGFRALAADAEAPAGIRERAAQMLGVLGAAQGASG